MVTVSHIVKKLIKDQPLLHEALSHNIVNYANLAEQLKDDIESELGSEVKETAIIMALRRLAEKLQKIENPKLTFAFNPEIVMKTGLADVTCVSSPSLLKNLKKIYELVDYDKGETLNIIQGNYEITIVINQKHLAKLKKVLKEEKVTNVEKSLVSLAMSLTEDFFYTPGVLAKVTRELVWQNINIYENISTMTEIIFIVNNKDSIRAFNTLQRLTEESKSKT